MKIEEIRQLLDATIVTDVDSTMIEVDNGFVGDLLSVVMGKAKENCAWITIQSHINIVAVASLVGVGCIIVSEGYKVDPDAIAKGIEEDILILSSPYSSYDCAMRLAKAGLGA